MSVRAAMLLLACLPLTLRAQAASPAFDSARTLDLAAFAAAQDSTSEELARAAALWTDAAQAYETAGAYGIAARRLARVARIHLHRKLVDSTLVVAERALELERRADELWLEFWDRYLIVELLRALDRPEEAEAWVQRIDAFTQARHHVQAAADAFAIEATLGLAMAPEDVAPRLEQARALYRELGDFVGEARTLWRAGEHYRAYARADSARAFYEESFRLAATAGERALAAATAVSMAGLARDHDGDAAAGLAWLREAERLAPQVDTALLGWLTYETALTQHALERMDSATAAFERAIPLLLGREPGLHASALAWLGAMRERSGDLAGARAHYTAALGSALENLDRRTEVMARWGLARSLRRLGTADALHAAAAQYDSASTAALMVDFSISTRADPFRLGMLGGLADLAGEWALTWLALRPAVGDTVAVFSAFAAAERGRGNALGGLLRQGLMLPHVPGEDLVQEAKRALPIMSPAARTVTVSFTVTRDTLLIFAGRRVPGEPLGSVKVWARAISPDSLAALVAAIRAGWGVEEGGRGMVRPSPTRSSVSTVATAARGAAAVALEALRRALLPIGLVEWLKSERATELLIVPGGPLHLLPFAVLPADSGGTPLSELYALRYTPALGQAFGRGDFLPPLRSAVLVPSTPGGDGAAAPTIQSVRERRAWLADALLVADPLMPDGPSVTGEPVRLERLNGARAEGAAIAARLGVVPLEGAAASETSVRRRLQSATVIHLATHGLAYADPELADESWVALAPDTLNDGFLTAGEILGLEGFLTADLVVLSACQTGLGNLHRAEGMVGLARAFLGRGARTVLVSLWSVSDAATSTLMDRFYAHWLGDADRPSKAEALRRSQEDVRATPGWEHPVYWAAFQLLGGDG